MSGVIDKLAEIVRKHMGIPRDLFYTKVWSHHWFVPKRPDKGETLKITIDHNNRIISSIYGIVSTWNCTQMNKIWILSHDGRNVVCVNCENNCDTCRVIYNASVCQECYLSLN